MRLKHIDDRELLHRTAAGDQRAFARFCRGHLDAVVAYFRRRVPYPELAFDLVAETFASVVASADTYDGAAPVEAWLYGIARNKLRDSLRRRRVEDSARERLGLEPVFLSDRDLERLEARASMGEDQLRRELEALPEPTRRALLARFGEERCFPDIARELQRSEQVVRQRLHSGLSRTASGPGGGRRSDAFNTLERQLKRSVRKRARMFA